MHMHTHTYICREFKNDEVYILKHGHFGVFIEPLNYLCHRIYSTIVKLAVFMSPSTIREKSHLFQFYI